MSIYIDYRQLIIPSIITFVPIPDHFNYTFFEELNYRFKITPRKKNKDKTSIKESKVSISLLKFLLLVI